MRKLLSVAISGIFFCQVCVAQSKTLEVYVGPDIKLPSDSATSQRLIHSINALINLPDSTMNNSFYIDKEDSLINLSFFGGITSLPIEDKYKDSSFYKPYLTNVYQLPTKDYAIQVAYVGITPEKQAVIEYIFTAIAKDKGTYFSFASPLSKNIANWHRQQIGMVNFYYKSWLDEQKARNFSDYTTDLCKKFGVPVFTLDYYKCENMQDAFKLIGIDYDLDGNGDNGGEGSLDDGVNMFISGTNTEDYKHDVFHFFCGKYIKAEQRCRITEEGCATIFGGDWGVPADTVIDQLKKYIAANPGADLYKLFHENNRLYKAVRFQVAFSTVINKYLEQQQGFGAVMKLLHAGEGEENYFKVLFVVSGINKDNFNIEFRKILK